VIQEIYNGNQSPLSGSAGASSRINIEETPKIGPELPSAGHNDVITDLVLCRTQKQTFVASSSRDGVIKLWK
jgi:phosphoinositide-3-kinase, regulatory subunit 4